MNYKFKPIKKFEIKNKLEKSLKRLLKDDFYLLKSDAHERSITHKLAEYLQDEFVEWNVDCEYNRERHDEIKQLRDWTKKYEKEIKNDEENVKNVFPDIIVHHRQTKNNLLVIEVKKSSNNDCGDSDKEKLKAFINELGYEYGVFINFETKIKDDYGIKELEWFPKTNLRVRQKNESRV